jgi:hypothetical protein
MNNFRGILICAIFRPRDMQEYYRYMLFWIFARDTEKRNIIVTFQSGQLTEQPKTLDDLGRFDLKMFRNCPIRIEIITGSHVFILFLPRVVTLCLYFIARGKMILKLRFV